jgi:hypothetical protein
MLLLSQTLTSLEKQQVLKQTVTAGDNYHLKAALQAYLRLGPHRRRRRGRGKKDKDWIPRREPQFPIATGDQAVPKYDPKWDPENDKDEWNCNHFIHCILEGLRRAKVKPLNYP